LDCTEATKEVLTGLRGRSLGFGTSDLITKNIEPTDDEMKLHLAIEDTPFTLARKRVEAQRSCIQIHGKRSVLFNANK